MIVQSRKRITLIIASIIAMARFAINIPLRTFSKRDYLNLYLPMFIIILVSVPV